MKEICCCDGENVFSYIFETFGRLSCCGPFSPDLSHIFFFFFLRQAGAQISLAELSCSDERSTKWYNLLSHSFDINSKDEDKGSDVKTEYPLDPLIQCLIIFWDVFLLFRLLLFILFCFFFSQTHVSSERVRASEGDEWWVFMFNWIGCLFLKHNDVMSYLTRTCCSLLSATFPPNMIITLATC